MNRKIKILLFIILMLIVGCGEVNNVPSRENNNKLSVWMGKCELLGKIAQNANIKEASQKCIEVVNQLIEEKESYLTEVGNGLLDIWVGEYKFDEATSGPPPMVMDYKMEIYEEEGRYFAEIEAMGQTTMASAKAEVDGNENEISLIFREYLPDHIIGLKCEKGDIVLRLVREGGELHTYWGKMKPLLYENEESGKIYFTKEVDDNLEELSIWIGEYIFSEDLDNSKTAFGSADYRIRIYREDNQIYAEVQVGEEKTYIRVKANVRGNENEIRLFLLEILPGHMCSSINKEGSILLKLREIGGEIYTDWGEIAPILEENQEYGKKYFEKVL